MIYDGKKFETNYYPHIGFPSSVHGLSSPWESNPSIGPVVSCTVQYFCQSLDQHCVALLCFRVESFLPFLHLLAFREQQQLYHIRLYGSDQTAGSAPLLFQTPWRVTFSEELTRTGSKFTLAVMGLRTKQYAPHIVNLFLYQQPFNRGRVQWIKRSRFQLSTFRTQRTLLQPLSDTLAVEYMLKICKCFSPSSIFFTDNAHWLEEGSVFRFIELFSISQSR